MALAPGETLGTPNQEMKSEERTMNNEQPHRPGFHS
jgi:hypothetical protein